MTQNEWLLFLLAVRDASVPLDPVRLQKGMFLLAQEGGIAEGSRYGFEPYDYGPFSSRIYEDLDSLVERGWVVEQDVPGYSWQRFTATQEGIEAANELLQRMTPEELKSARWLVEVKRTVLALDFKQLLSYVYVRHPDYAVNSIFRG